MFDIDIYIYIYLYIKPSNGIALVSTGFSPIESKTPSTSIETAPPLIEGIAYSSLFLLVSFLFLLFSALLWHC